MAKFRIESEAEVFNQEYELLTVTVPWDPFQRFWTVGDLRAIVKSDSLQDDDILPQLTEAIRIYRSR